MVSTATYRRGRVEEFTVQSCVHATKVHQQAHHCHADSRGLVVLQFVLQDLTGLAAPRHRVDVDVSKVHLLLSVGVSCEDGSLVFEDEFKELVLDILSPQGDAILLFQMSNLVSRVDGTNRPICLASCTNRRAGRRAVGMVVCYLGNSK